MSGCDGCIRLAKRPRENAGRARASAFSGWVAAGSHLGSSVRRGGIEHDDLVAPQRVSISETAVPSGASDGDGGGGSRGPDESAGMATTGRWLRRVILRGGRGLRRGLRRSAAETDLGSIRGGRFEGDDLIVPRAGAGDGVEGISGLDESAGMGIGTTGRWLVPLVNVNNVTELGFGSSALRPARGVAAQLRRGHCSEFTGRRYRLSYPAWGYPQLLQAQGA